MDAARRLHREQRLPDRRCRCWPGPPARRQPARPSPTSPTPASRGLAAAALAEVERQGGAFPGEVARGRARQVRLARDDRRLRPRPDDLLRGRDARRGVGASKGWAAETFYGRFTQRLITALSAPTGEGELYEVDMQLRPSGTKGPVAVSFARVRELLRRRGGDLGVPGPDPRPGGLGELAGVRRRERPPRSSRRCARRATPRRTAADVRAMRELMARERPAVRLLGLQARRGRPGRHRVRRPVPAAGPRRRRRAAAARTPRRRWRRCARRELAPVRRLVDDLADAWRLQQDLSQLLKVALADGRRPGARAEGAAQR